MLFRDVQVSGSLSQGIVLTSVSGVASLRDVQVFNSSGNDAIRIETLSDRVEISNVQLEGKRVTRNSKLYSKTKHAHCIHLYVIKCRIFSYYPKYHASTLSPTGLT